MKNSELFEHYIAHIQSSLTQSTVDTYKHKLSTVLRLLGDKECNVVSSLDAQKFIDSLETNYKSKTVRGFYDVVKAAFNYGCSEGLTDSNPFQNVAVNKVTRHEAVILDKSSITAFVDSSASNASLYLPILIASETGLRRSQVLALMWNDIDFSEATILVNKNVISSKAHIFTEGKEHQQRTISMSSHLSEVLLEVKNYRRTRGVGVEPQDYICLTSNFKTLEPTYFDKLFRTFVRSSQYVPDDFRFHDLRWSYIRAEVESGSDPMTIADKVGHKSCVFTMDYYYRYRKNAA